MMKEIVAQELEKERQENDDQAKRGHSCIPDRGRKVAWSGKEGEKMQGMPEWRG